MEKLTRIEKYRLEKEEKQRRKEQFSKKASVFAIVFMAVVVVGALVYYFCFLGAWSYYSKGEDHILNQNTIKNFELLTNENRVCESYNDMLLVCDKNGVSAYDKSGKNKWNISLSLNEAMIDVCENYALVADRKGKVVYIIRNGKIIQENHTQYNIMNASVSDDGGYVVITEDDEYKSLVSVKDASGKEVFVWHSANAYAIDAEISKNFKSVMISTLNTEVLPSGDRTYASMIQIFDIKHAKSVFSKTAEDDIYVDIGSVKGGFIALSQKSVTKFDEKGNEKSSFAFNGKCGEYAFDGKKLAVVSFDEQYRDKITVFDSDLKVVGSKELGDKTVEAIDLYSSVLSYVSGGEIYICKENTEVRYRIKTDKIYKALTMFCRGKRAFVLGEFGGAVVETK